MLFKKTAYLDDFPINIIIAEVTEYPFHYHQDIEFIYVLKGEIRLKNVCHHYLLSEGDVFTNSGHEVHGLTATDKENVVAIIQVSNRFFTQYFPTLGKACFMSYVNDDKYFKMDILRKMLLHILLDYSMRNFNYKEACVDRMIQVIKYLNQHFNLFAFEDQTVVDFQNDNSVVVDRISRIINYVYENHANRITLEDLAEREHLSTFYISHLIREYMGINFQELLCFARVEMSEILLLETDQKISEIARDVGFSTTSYYEKFFGKWFGHNPLEYRQLYVSQILGPERPARLKELSENNAVNLIRRCLSAVIDQEESASVINRLHLRVDVNPDGKSVMKIEHFLEVVITEEDYKIMGDQLFNMLEDINASRVVIASSHSGDGDANPRGEIEEVMTNRLESQGYEVSILWNNGLDHELSAGYDSIAEAIGIFQTYFVSKGKMLRCRLRDQGDPQRMLKGESSRIASCLVFKSSFYACKFLKNIKGELICWGKYYYVVKGSRSGKVCYTIVVINYSDDIQQLCRRNVGVYEANDVINSFNDELNVDFCIPAESGQYIIAKYALSNNNSIFEAMAQMGFPETIPMEEGWMRMLNTGPQTQVSIENVEDRLNISDTIKGAGVHIICVEEKLC